MKHTPGPWAIFSEHIEHPNGLVRFVGQSNFDEDSVTNTDEIVCKLTDSENIRGNAALIAAAPDLLAACKALLRLYDGLPWHVRDSVIREYNERLGVLAGTLPKPIAEARAAIARAEGGGA